MLVAQLRPAVWDPMDCSPLGCSVPGVLVQARILEWLAISFSRGSSPGSCSLRLGIAGCNRFGLKIMQTFHRIANKIKLKSHLYKPKEDETNELQIGKYSK